MLKIDGAVTVVLSTRNASAYVDVLPARSAARTETYPVTSGVSARKFIDHDDVNEVVPAVKPEIAVQFCTTVPLMAVPVEMKY